MSRKRKEVQTEGQIDHLYVVVTGFTDSEDRRFDSGTENKPTFVKKSDFKEIDWNEITKMKAVVPFEKDELGRDETIAAEIIE